MNKVLGLCLTMVLALLLNISCKNTSGGKMEINHSGQGANGSDEEVSKLKVSLSGNSIMIGKNFGISFQRTLRIPDDGNTYPLPPGLGTFPVKRVEDYKDKVPKSWLKDGGFFIPMYQREAMWLSFQGAHWRPNALKVGVGKVDAISGEDFSTKLNGEDQNYLVIPEQPWLDGINAGEGFIKQFVAMPLGRGYTVEGQVTGKEEFGGLQLMLFEPKPGKFPDNPPPPPKPSFWERVFGNGDREEQMVMESAPAEDSEMGLAAGGKMEQKLYPDPYGVDIWSPEDYQVVYVHIVNSNMYERITGEMPPNSPVSAETYTNYGYPWFALYDEGKGDIDASETLKGVKSVSEKDKENFGKSLQNDSTVDVSQDQIIKLDKKE